MEKLGREDLALCIGGSVLKGIISYTKQFISLIIFNVFFKVRS